jgi:hypothetical protein
VLSWRWSYDDEGAPPVTALADAFAEFELDEPIPRLALLEQLVSSPLLAKFFAAEPFVRYSTCIRTRSSLPWLHVS